MSRVWFGSDFHLGHANIHKFRKEIFSEYDNDERIFNDIERTVGKNDDLWVLGDWCFDKKHLDRWMQIRCRNKYLVRGNHDQFDLAVYMMAFDDVFGFLKYKDYWLSHAPVHPKELRGRINIHGHTHYENMGEDYFNVCPEQLWPKFGRCLVELGELRAIGTGRRD